MTPTDDITDSSASSSTNARSREQTGRRGADAAARPAYVTPRVVEIGRIGSSTFGFSGMFIDFDGFQAPD